MKKLHYSLLTVAGFCLSFSLPAVRTAFAESSSEFINSVRSIFIENGDGSAFTQITISNSQPSNIKLVLPDNDGASGDFLQTDGSGNLNWSPSTTVAFPAGTIIAYAGATIPTGWVDASGQVLSRTAYSALFAAIGTTWNTSVNPLTGVAYSSPGASDFRVPDLRGAFLRGTGGPNAAGVTTVLAGYQADTTAKNGLTNSSSSISGSTGQADQDIYASNLNQLNRAFTTFAASGYNSGDAAYNTRSHTHVVSGTAAAQSITGDVETRPDNVGVKYIIKI